MKVPNNILWSIIGDVFSSAFKDDDMRGAIEIFWQTMLENSSDNIKYIQHLKNLKSIMLASPYEPYGNVPCAVSIVREGAPTLVRGQHLSGGVFLFYSNSKISPRSVVVNERSYSIGGFSETQLKSGGYVYRTLLNEEIDYFDGRFFLHSEDLSGVGRFSDFLTYPVEATNYGLIFSPENVDISGVRDEEYISGAYPYRVSFIGNISNLSTNSAIDVASYSDIGSPYHVQITSSQILYGISGYESAIAIDTALGDFELELVYDNINKKIKSNVYINDSTYETPWVSVPASRRRHSFCAINESTATLSMYIDKEGRRWNSEDVDKNIAVYFSEYPYTYSLEFPLVSSDLMSVDPYVYPIEVYVENGVMTSVDESISYIPENYRYEDLLNPNMEDGQYYIYPWFSSEFTFTSPGVISSKVPIPTEYVYFRNAYGYGVDLYERFGRVLGVPKKEDSYEYLSILQGVNHALRKSRTIKDIENACSIMIGVPFTRYGGYVNNYTEVFDNLTGTTFYDVELGREIIRLKNLYSIKSNYIEPMEPITEAVTVKDWVSNPELDRGAFSRWGSFVISIPVDVGMSKFTSSIMANTITRSKDPHKSFSIETSGQVTDSSIAVDSYAITAYPYVMEDLMFDDDDSVYGNTIGYEDQTDEDGELDDTHMMLDFGLALDSSKLTRPRPSIQQQGKQVLPNYELNTRLLGESLYYGSQDVFIGRESDDPSFWSKDLLRMVSNSELHASLASFYSAAHNYTPRARCVHWVYENDTDVFYEWKVNPVEPFSPAPAMVTDAISVDSYADYTLLTDGSDVYEYDGGWDSTSTPTSINDITYHAGTDNIFTVGDSNKVYKKEIGAVSWTDVSPSGSSNIKSVHYLKYLDDSTSPYVLCCGDNGFIKIREDAAGSWSDVSIVTTEDLVSCCGFRDSNIWVSGTNGFIQKSDDGGSSWSDSSIVTSATITGISSGVDVYCCDSDGYIYIWTGASWSTIFTSSGSLNSIFVSIDGTVTAVGNSGLVVRYTGYSWYEENQYTIQNLNKVKNNTVCGDGPILLYY